MQFQVLFMIVVYTWLTKSSFLQRVDASDGDKLLLILLDGFRWDYLETLFKDEKLPGFQKLQENGVRAKSLKPTFPSLSYVNYYSLMTGLHAETHGMIHNYMYDPPSGLYFLIGENPDQYNPLWWNDGEPLWVTAEKQGKRAYFWYWGGCEVQIRGVRPTFCQPYLSAPNPSFENFTTAFDSAIEVLRNGSADVAGVFYEQVDHWGHAVGPRAGKVADVIRQVDGELVRVLGLLDTTRSTASGKKLNEVVNIMIFSDHGMTPIIDPVAGIFRLNTSLLSPDDVVIGSNTGPILQIYPKENENVLYDRLKNLHPNVTVYMKKDIPERFLLKRHQRTPPLLLVADKGYVIQYKPNVTSTDIGFHGFDNELQDMHGIFFAKGPQFKRGKQPDGLRNVDLYQVMCHLLGITASPNNGTWASVNDIFNDILVFSGGGIGQSLHPAFPLLLSLIAAMISNRI